MLRAPGGLSPAAVVLWHTACSIYFRNERTRKNSKRKYDKAKPTVRWGRKTTGPDLQRDSRVTHKIKGESKWVG